MILQALCEYYDRKSQESDSAIAPLGFEEKSIPFLIVINEKGEFIQLEDTRELQGKNLIARSFLVPKAKGRSGSKSYETVNCLWDHYGYLLKQSKLLKPVRPTSLAKNALTKDIIKRTKDQKSYLKKINSYRKERKKSEKDADNQHETFKRLYPTPFKLQDKIFESCH